jgi:uncharacterized protein (DUF697 family)
MSIKKFFVGMAVLLSVSLFVIGCPTEADGVTGERGSDGLSAGTLPSGASAELFDAYFSRLNTVFLTDPLAAGEFIVPPKKTLVVVGDVTLAGGTIINAFNGTLDVVDGGFAGANGVLIVADAQRAAVKAKAENLSVPATATVGDTEIDEDVVLTSLTIGDEGWDDFATFAGSTYTVYVNGDVEIDATTAVTTGSVSLTVFGDVKAKGTLTLGAAATAKSLTATDTLALTGIANIKELNTATYVVTATDTSVALAKLNSGAGGKLVLPGTVTAVTIDGGNGNIDFITGSPAFAAGATFGNTGLTTFAKPVTVAKSASEEIVFEGPVAFADDLTLTAVPATFKGHVSFANGKKITMTTAASIVTLGPGVYLGLPSAQPVYSSVIHNPGQTGNVTLTPAINTTLTFATGRNVSQSGTGSTHSIAITGKASLPAGAIYTVASTSSAIGTLTVNGELLVAAGVLGGDEEDDNSAKLVLTGAAGTDGAKLAGAGAVKAGGTTIVGSTGGWQAVTGNITIEADTITAASSGVLTGVTSGTPSITVAAAGTLTVATGTTIGLATNGSIVLTKGAGADPGPAVTGGTLNLATTSAKIDGLTGGTTDRTLTTSNITNATYTVGTDSGKVTGGGTASAGNAYITGGNATGPNPIVADTTANATIDKTTTIGS